MTKILEISGDGDYNAVSYEDAARSGEVNTSELWDKSKEAGKWLEYENEGTDTYFSYKAHEFGDVDEGFIDLVLNEIADYDLLKSHCIYVVEG